MSFRLYIGNTSEKSFVLDGLEPRGFISNKVLLYDRCDVTPLSVVSRFRWRMLRHIMLRGQEKSPAYLSMLFAINVDKRGGVATQRDRKNSNKFELCSSLQFFLVHFWFLVFIGFKFYFFNRKLHN